MFSRYKYKIIPTKEQSIRRIIGSLFLMVFGIYMLCLFAKTVGVISIIISSVIILFHLYILIFLRNKLSSMEIKIIAGKLPNDEEK
ncbi:hypothetical protein ACJDU8_09870 [Clostridium sp. WILCCON 0269]|uniref:Uncharacterized protein n=1 Tax=Candidatus Clostridium eludens TaxID=3381663 RepID=A0ABW8SIL2_9CLOT